MRSNFWPIYSLENDPWPATEKASIIFITPIGLEWNHLDVYKMAAKNMNSTSRKWGLQLTSGQTDFCGPNVVILLKVVEWIATNCSSHASWFFSWVGVQSAKLGRWPSFLICNTSFRFNLVCGGNPKWTPHHN